MEPTESFIQTIIQIVGGGLATSILLYFVWSVYKNPDILAKWIKLTEGIRRRLFFFLRHKKTTREYKKAYERHLKAINEKMGGILPKKIDIKFVNPMIYGHNFVKGSRRNGSIKIIKSWDEDVGNTFQAITHAYFKYGSFQDIRSLISAPYMEGLDIALTLSALDSSHRRDALHYFTREVVKPILGRDKNDETSRFFRMFQDLDGAGMLTTILSRELGNIEKGVANTPTSYKADSEAKSLLLFLDRIRHKRKGEDVELTFDGSIVRFNMVCVGKRATKKYGKSPYVKRITEHLNRGDTVYVWGVGEPNSQMADEIAEYHFRAKVKARFIEEYHTSDFRVLQSRIIQLR